MDVAPSMQKAGIAGPIFISIGDEEGEKLSLFLEKNPRIPKSTILTDNYAFNAYKAMGFGKIGDDKEAMKGAKMKAPEGVNMWSYMSVAGKLAPIPKSLKFGQIPEGVLYLGGTFAIDGNRFAYTRFDPVPGDHPDPAQVLSEAFRVSIDA